ncbi:MAG: sulfatase [Kofleriaceae bacterium]
MSVQRWTSAALRNISRGAFLVRQALASRRRELHEQRRRDSLADLELGRSKRGPGRRRNILFITVDQQRFDALGVNGGTIARTPTLDALANAGLRYTCARVPNVVCMPSRASMLTGQSPQTHGVIANGVPLPQDAPSVARHLRRAAGYRTALVGKAHFEPHLDPTLFFDENRMAADGACGPWHGFEHVELATHGPLGGHHYANWMWTHHRDELGGFGGVLTGIGGGDTGAPEVTHNPVAREHYHTDWVADRTIRWLGSVPTDEPWLCWMSFPDPHHPFDPPLDEVRARIDWRDLPLPPGHPGSRERIEALLAKRPRHWLDWYRGDFRNPEGGPIAFVPSQMTDDQLREVHAMIHVENELIDEACGRVLAFLRARGLDEHTDIVYTSDHGDLQGDLGLLFKGPYHVDSLIRVPTIWRPAPSAAIPPARIDTNVSHIDLAPTFCAIAGVDMPSWMEGEPMPTTPTESRPPALTTFDSQFMGVGMHLRTIHKDGVVCTLYELRTHDRGGRFRVYWSIWGAASRIPDYDGSEGELYDTNEDPLQWHNRWSDPSLRALRDELIEELRARLRPERQPALPFASPT